MATDEINIDGARGEGGGQVLRTALGLSALTGRPFSIKNVRAGRKKPGLMRQHLAAVRAAAQICSASVRGAEIGSEELSFQPGAVTPGDYTFAIGSAGSTTLVLQTVLPALLTASGPSTITLEGGTHNPLAPPVDFIEHAFLPVVNRMGPRVDLKFDRHGFYPAGGGRWSVAITPAAKLTPVTINTRGKTKTRQAKAIVAGLSGSIALRELERVEARLGWSGDDLCIRQIPDDEGPGNVVMLKIESEHVTEVFTSFGSKGITAMAVADEAVDQTRAYLLSTAPVGVHLADQLLIPFALAGGGNYVATGVTPHATSNIEVIHAFLDVRITTGPAGEGGALYAINSPA
ncbi:MAG TPA: RNA 3'-terminal phosphate cyclase [Tepidisphaeraceae bacterium]|jgi:RNA 3'-terminal phosphate cyclase (ATP)